MTDQGKNTLIGIFALTACAIVVWILLILKPSAGDGKETLYVRFPDIDKISVGTRVTYAGKPVGEITAVAVIDNARDVNQLHRGSIYTYELTLTIDSGVTVYSSDRIAVHTSGLLGEKSIAITPRHNTSGKPPELMNGSLMYATDTGSVEETLDELSELTTRGRETMDIISELVAANSAELQITIQSISEGSLHLKALLKDARDADLITNTSRMTSSAADTLSLMQDQINLMAENKIAERMSSLVGNLDSIAGAINPPEKLTSIVDNMHQLSSSLNTLESKVSTSWADVDSSLKNFSAASNEGRAAMAELKELVHTVNEGKGNLGKLIHGDDLYLRSQLVLGKAETLMNDINHYGLLFHLDKGWQRTRTRRMNMLSKLSAPQDFREFFEEEIDQISTSLSRVSVVLEEMNSMKASVPPKERKAFLQLYGELLNRVETLEDSLKMYNQQYVEETYTP